MANNDSRFADKVALVTGGASGIGAATVRAFARQGAKVVIADLPDQAVAAQQMIALLRDVGVDARFVACDVSRDGDGARVVREVIDQFGRLDCAFNNAAVEGVGSTTHLAKLADWDRVMAVNVRGVFLCLQAELRAMLDCGGGAIVNCSSGAGLSGVPNWAAYATSKHAVIGLTRTAALEYARQGIRINAICPGVIETPMLRRWINGDKAVEERLLGSEPIGRAGSTEEVAESVMWLCSSAASYVTGHALSVDGGWAAQ